MFWRVSTDPARRVEALGRVGAVIERLKSAGAPVGVVMALEADRAAQAPAEAEALLALMRPLLGSKPAAAYSLTPSPISPRAGAPTAARDVAPEELGVRAAAMLSTWRSEKSRRRRQAAGAEDGLALILRPEIAPAAAREAGLAPGLWASRWRAETGETVNQTCPDSPCLEAFRPEAAWPKAARAAAKAAEAALGGPAELLIERDGADGFVIRDARPLAARPAALAEIATAMLRDGALSEDDAVMAVRAESLEEILHASVAPEAARDVIARGYAASPGAVAGRLCFDAEQAEAMARGGEPVIIVRVETEPEDVHGMQKAVGVLTTRGGLTSHAAVVARGLGLPCVVGAADARLEEGALRAADGRALAAGDWITLDGSAGEALAGKAPTRRPEPSGAIAEIMALADKRRRLRVRANADTPQDAETAVRLGVDGVGLCRTEHMFFDPGRISVMREMILADDGETRRATLAKLLPMQRADFAAMFRILGDAPATIRLLDPPLHEFLPQTERGLDLMAEAMSAPPALVKKRARDLAEVNPMLGKRGCRLGVAYPEIYEMQARAIFEAALDVAAEGGPTPRPEIMVPLVSAMRELEAIREHIDAVADAVRAERGRAPDYGVGIMVETPRAALRAGQLGASAAFFSFGTNDLTQMTYGLSRDDAGRLMRDYVERGVFEADPFQSLDRDGVGELMRIAAERGRAANPTLELGICGEHGGDPGAIDFCEEAGFDYVSCSPFRAPIARLAAAQAAIRREALAAHAKRDAAE